MKERSKNPSSIVYWNDLANDDELKTCSRAARGLWTTELLPMAAASTEPGVVQIGTRPCVWDGDLPGLLANKGGGTAGEVLELLTDLVQSGAAGVDDRGRIFNRRMVREEEKRRQKSSAGKLGMSRRWGNHADNRPVTDTITDGITESAKPRTEQPIDLLDETGPSRQPGTYQTDNEAIASSLLHDSKTLSNGESHTVTAPRKRAEPKGERLPEGWEPSEELKAWTRAEIAAAGADARINPGKVLLEFRDYWRGVPGRPGRKLDWPGTWRNRIRALIERKGKPYGSSSPKDGKRSAVAVAATFATAFGGAGDRGSSDDGEGT